jgi:peptidoglycan/xylan/chitin deacetylase (PgdA/CDA1 family)
MSMNKTVFFRDDDVQDCDINFKKFIGLFLWHKIPVHLAVIPGNMTVRCEAFLRQCLKKYPELIEIGQHGYKHLNYSQDVMRKYEFGTRRTYAEQKKDIARGKGILSKITKDKLIFTPPWHGFDKNTLKVISGLGFLGISLDRKSRMPNNIGPIRNIMTSVYFNKKNLYGWFVEKADIILNEIKALKDIKVGVLVHHNKFNSDKEFKELSDLLFKLEKTPGIRFCKLSEIDDKIRMG